MFKYNTSNNNYGPISKYTVLNNMHVNTLSNLHISQYELPNNKLSIHTSHQYIQVINSNKSYKYNSQIHKAWTHDISCKSLTVTHTKKLSTYSRNSKYEKVV